MIGAITILIAYHALDFNFEQTCVVAMSFFCLYLSQINGKLKNGI